MTQISNPFLSLQFACFKLIHIFDALGLHVLDNLFITLQFKRTIELFANIKPVQVCPFALSDQPVFYIQAPQCKITILV